MAATKRLSAKQVLSLINKAGGNRALARLAGVSPGSVSKWRHEGVSAEYGKKLSDALARPARKKRAIKKVASKLQRRIRELEEQLEEAKESGESLLDLLNQKGPVVSLEQIIQVFRLMGRPPDLEEAKGLADDYLTKVKEIYDIYYEES